MGKIFNIQRFCVDDGPGIRTTVFFSGCPLKCLWCHNPESWNINGNIFYYPSRCVSCGRCTKLCQCHTISDGKHVFDRTKCVTCGKCTKTDCGALEYTVKEYSAQEVIKEVQKDIKFFESSGGGLTVSGGEPMMQFYFLYELLSMAKESNIHTCIETSGFADTNKFEKISSLVDIFLYDYKMTDSVLHKKYTGVSNELIIKNLERLNELGAKIVLRCVIIPGINDDREHLEAIGKIADKMDSIYEVCIEPYHSMGNSKRANMDKAATLEEIQPPQKEDIERIIKIINTKKKCTY